MADYDDDNDNMWDGEEFADVRSLLYVSILKINTRFVISHVLSPKWLFLATIGPYNITIGLQFREITTLRGPGQSGIIPKGPQAEKT